MATPRQYRTEGASKSLNRTIGELTSILNGIGIKVTGRLRPRLYDRIEDLAEEWYRKGFARGVETVRTTPVKATKKVFFLRKGTGRSRRVVLREP
jgi:hypothetical protein